MEFLSVRRLWSARLVRPGEELPLPLHECYLCHYESAVKLRFLALFILELQQSHFEDNAFVLFPTSTHAIPFCFPTRD